MGGRRNRLGVRAIAGARWGWLFAAFATLGVACGGEPAPPNPTPPPSTAAPPAATATAAATPAPIPPTATVALEDAYALLRAGQYDEAAAAFAGIAESSREAATVSAAQLGAAVVAYELGEDLRSLALLGLAARSAPAGSAEEARAVYLLGVRLNEDGAHAEAVGVLQPHAVLGSGLALSPYIVAEYARALAGIGNAARAEVVWESLLATPALGEQLRLPILRQRAALARASGDLEERRRWLGEIVTLTGDPTVRYELAAVGFLLEDYDLFEEQLRAIVVTSPSTEEALFALRDLRDAGLTVDAGDEGYVHYRHRDFDRARTVLARAVAEAGLTGEQLAYRTYFLAAAHDDDGFYLESIPYYDSVAANAEAGVFAHRARYWAARALESAGRFEEAAQRYDGVALETGSQFAAESAFRSGFARLRGGDLAGAIAAWEAWGGGDARTLYWLGRTHANLDDERAAQKAFLEARAAQPLSFHGLEASRALDLEVGGEGGYAPLAPPPAPDWEGLAAWLATHRPGALPEVGEEATELALVGLSDLAAEGIERAAADTGDPWMLLALAREASRAGLAEQASSIAFRIQSILRIDGEALPPTLARLRYPLPHAALLEAEGEANGLDPLLLAALIYQESRWDPKAVSIAHAVGLTQVIEPTAAWIAERLGEDDFVLGDLFRPAVSLRFGAYYLGIQLLELGEVHQALAAYNGGPTNARRWASIAAWPPADYVEAITFGETRHYVQLVMEHYAWYRALYGPGAGG